MHSIVCNVDMYILHIFGPKQVPTYCGCGFYAREVYFRRLCGYYAEVLGLPRDKLIQRNINLPLDLYHDLEAFCERTARQPTHVMRAIIGLFFKDGHAIAEQRLTQNLWDPRQDAPQTTDAVDPEWIVTGQPSVPDKKERKRGA